MDGMGHALFAARVATRPRQIEIKSVDNSLSLENAKEINILRVRTRTLESQLSALINKLYPPSLPQDIPEPISIRNPTIAEIIMVVCKFFRFAKNEIVSPRRDKITVRMRDIAIYQCKIWTCRSYPEIGRSFGGRDHTSIMHAFRKIASERLIDEGLDAQLKQIHAKIAQIVTPPAKSVNNERSPVHGAVANPPLAAAPEIVK